MFFKKFELKMFSKNGGDNKVEYFQITWKCGWYWWVFGIGEGSEKWLEKEIYYTTFVKII